MIWGPDDGAFVDILNLPLRVCVCHIYIYIPAHTHTHMQEEWECAGAQRSQELAVFAERLQEANQSLQVTSVQHLSKIWSNISRRQQQQASPCFSPTNHKTAAYICSHVLKFEVIACCAMSSHVIRAEI